MNRTQLILQLNLILLDLSDVKEIIKARWRKYSILQPLNPAKPFHCAVSSAMQSCTCAVCCHLSCCQSTAIIIDSFCCFINWIFQYKPKIPIQFNRIYLVVWLLLQTKPSEEWLCNFTTSKSGIYQQRLRNVHHVLILMFLLFLFSPLCFSPGYYLSTNESENWFSSCECLCGENTLYGCCGVY